VVLTQFYAIRRDQRPNRLPPIATLPRLILQKEASRHVNRLKCTMLLNVFLTASLAALLVLAGGQYKSRPDLSPPKITVTQQIPDLISDDLLFLTVSRLDQTTFKNFKFDFEFF
jgi:hypothetical protein